MISTPRLDKYLAFSKKELESLDIDCDIYYKEKKTNTTVDSRYFRFNLKYLFGPENTEISISGPVGNKHIHTNTCTHTHTQNENLGLAYSDL